MRKTHLLQEVRHMRFEEIYGRWRRGRLSQIDKFMAKLKGHSPQQEKTQEVDDNIQIDDELTQVYGV